MDSCSKAVIVKAFGSYDSLSIDEYPLESLEANVEVKVSFCGLNLADLYARQGLLRRCKAPFVLGIECVGIVTAVGCVTSNSSVKVGQRVICYNHNGGLFRDVIRVNPSKIYPLPDYISFESGATLFTNYVTAYFTLFELGNLKEGETVFIQSCAGGVGIAVTQLAKTLKNITVIGTASESKHEFAQKNGVDHVLTYEDLIEKLRNINPSGFDLIIDNQSGHIFNELQCLLKPLGRIVSIGANSVIQDDNMISIISLLKLWWTTKHVSIVSLIEGNRVVAALNLGILTEKEPLKVRKVLDILYTLYKEEKIIPKIDSIWAFEDVAAASRVLGERRNIGKVLLSLDQ